MGVDGDLDQPGWRADEVARLFGLDRLHVLGPRGTGRRGARQGQPQGLAALDELLANGRAGETPRAALAADAAP